MDHPYVGAYGHLEDELRRVNGRWLISRHQVFNEQRENMASGSDNPACSGVWAQKRPITTLKRDYFLIRN